MWSREHPTLPDEAKTWFNRARFAGSVMAVGSMLTGIAGAFFIFLVQLAFSLDDDQNPDEPWSTEDVWLVCVYFVWLFALPTIILVAFNYVERKRRYLYVCTLLLLLAAAAQIAFVLYNPRSILFLFQGMSLIKYFSLAGWFVTLCLISVVWSEIRLAGRLAS